MRRYKCVFSSNQEQELIDCVQDIESRLFGLTTTELKRLVHQFGSKKIVYITTLTDQIGVLDWLKGFLKRDQNLSLQTPAATSAAEVMRFNEVCMYRKVFRYIYKCDRKV